MNNGYEKLQTGDPVVKLNIKYGNVVENPQEKPKNPYKLDFSITGKDKKSNLYINMPLENAGEEGDDNFAIKDDDYDA